MRGVEGSIRVIPSWTRDWMQHCIAVKLETAIWLPGHDLKPADCITPVPHSSVWSRTERLLEVIIPVMRGPPCVQHLPSCTSGMRLKVPTHSNALRPHRAYVPAVTGLSTLWIMLMLPLIETGYCTYVCKSLTEPTPTSVLLKENVRIPLIVMWTQRRTCSPLTICSPSLEWNKYFQHFSNDCVKQVCVTQTVSA